MSLFKTFTRFSFFTLILITYLQNIVLADGGFPVRPGRILIAPSVSYFFSSTQWDQQGVKTAFPNDGKYTSLGLTLYAEYGISRRFAAVASLPLVYNTYTQNTAPRTTNTTGATDLETGIRYYLANINFVYYFSLQGTAITPTYSNNPNLGYGKEGAELKLAFSGTADMFGTNAYFNASDGVRQYFGTNGPIQNRYTGTFGLSLDSKFKSQLSVSLSGINSFSDDKSFVSGIPETNKDYSFIQASLSYGYSISHEIALYGTGGTFLRGRNTSDGTIFSLAFIYRLDYR